MLEVVLDLGIDDAGDLEIEHRHLVGNDVECDHFVVLRQQNGIGQTRVADAGNCDFMR